VRLPALARDGKVIARADRRLAALLGLARLGEGDAHRVLVQTHAPSTLHASQSLRRPLAPRAGRGQA
jgi:hypothetical protein